MSWPLTLRIPKLPPSLNKRLEHRYNKVTSQITFFKSRHANDFQRETQKLWKQKYPDHTLLQGELEVDVVITFPDKRRRDTSNFTKDLYDALIGHAYVDDSQIVKETLCKKISKSDSGIEIKIKEFKLE